MQEEPRKVAPDDIDQPFDVTLQRMEELIQRGAVVFVKWTCPGCGERCMSDVPNSICATGYYHTEKHDGTRCGTPYTGGEHGMYGLVAIMPLAGSAEATRKAQAEMVEAFTPKVCGQDLGGTVTPCPLPGGPRGPHQHPPRASS
jgi:hypothetical protein